MCIRTEHLLVRRTLRKRGSNRPAVYQHRLQDNRRRERLLVDSRPIHHRKGVVGREEKPSLGIPGHAW